MIGTTIKKQAFLSYIPGTKQHVNRIAGNGAPSLAARIPGTAAHVQHKANQVQKEFDNMPKPSVKSPSMKTAPSLKSKSSIGSTITNAIKKNPKTAIGGALAAGAIGGAGAMMAKRKMQERKQLNNQVN